MLCGNLFFKYVHTPPLISVLISQSGLFIYKLSISLYCCELLCLQLYLILRAIRVDWNIVKTFIVFKYAILDMKIYCVNDCKLVVRLWSSDRTQNGFWPGSIHHKNSCYYQKPWTSLVWSLKWQWICTKLKLHLVKVLC